MFGIQKDKRDRLSPTRKKISQAYLMDKSQTVKGRCAPAMDSTQAHAYLQ